MRLLSLHLRAFGPFIDFELPFQRDDGSDPGLTIVYGPNEAGKSTALRAIRQLFFGIEGEKDDYRTSKPQLRVGGVLRDDAGSVHEVLRRGRATKTLYKLDDKTKIDGDLLDTLLDSIDASTYETRFGLHHEDLEAGAVAVMESSGSLSAALFAATARTKDLQKLRSDLVERAEKLFKPQATKGPDVNRTIGDYKRLDEEANREERAGDVAIYRELRGRIAQMETDLATSRDERAAIVARIRLLQRYAELYPANAKRAALAAELAEMADVPVPSEDFEPRRRELEGERIALRERLRRGRTSLTEYEAATSNLGEPRTLLRHASEIERLSTESIALAAERRRAEDLSHDRTLAAEAADRSLRKFGDTIREADLERLDLPETFAASVREMIDARSRLDQKRRDDDLRRSQMRSRLEKLDAATEDSADDGSAARLDDALLRAKLASETAAPRERLLAEASARMAEANAWIARSMTRPVSPEALASLAVPSAEAIDEARAVAERLALARRQIAQERGDLELRLVDLRAALSRDDVQGLPSTDDLAQARAARDEAFKAVADRALVPDLSDQEAGGLFQAVRADAAKAEIVRLRETIAEADRLADVLRRDATRVAMLEQSRREERSGREKLTLLDSRIAEADEAIQRAENDWRERWASLGVRAEAPKAMSAWLRERERIVSVVAEASEKETQAAAMTARIEAARLALIAELGSEAETQPLEAALALGVRRKRVLDEARDAAIDRAGERKRLVEHLAAVEGEIGRVDERLDDWNARWERMLTTLPGSSDRRPDEALAFVERLAEWRRRRDELGRIDRELQIIARRKAAFDEEVAASAESFDPESAGSNIDSSAMVRRWMASLDEERRKDEERRRLRQSVEKSEAEIAVAEERAAVVDEELERICRSVGSSDLSALSERLESVARKRRTLAATRELDELLARRSPGSSWQDLARELADWTPDDLDTAIRDAEEESTKLGKRIEELERRLGESTAQRDANWTGDSKAADLAQTKQRYLAELMELSERYAVYRLASTALERSIERYRDKNKSPILERAQRIFAGLTCGAFRGLEPDGDSAGGISVVGLRNEASSEPHEVPVSGMSRGTCDQLYLAFRMALWEERLEKGTPLPIVLDDVLVHFDDERAAATLKAFDELAKRTQIVYFTHHRHLVELAQKTLPADRLLVRELRPSGVRT